jgi:serine protease Do
VRYVYAESPAAEAGLMPRDRIVEFNGQPVAGAVELARMVALVRPGDTVTLRYDRDGADATVEVELASVPEAIPDPLPTAAIPAAAEAAAEEEAGDGAGGNESRKGPRTGRYTVQMETQAHEYWVYVPDGYNPAHAYGLLVWIHPGGDAMEAATYNNWRAICDRRGLILLGPKAAEPRWNPNEAEFVKDAVAEIREKYNIDERRVFLHGYTDGAAFAYHLAFKYRDVFRGLSPAAMPITERPPENKPDARLAFHLVCGADDPMREAVEATATVLKRMKFPVSVTTVDGLGRDYPPEAILEEIGRWADCLDRI